LARGAAAIVPTLPPTILPVCSPPPCALIHSACAATMIGMNEGAEIGGNMAKDLSDACQVD